MYCVACSLCLESEAGSYDGTGMDEQDFVLGNASCCKQLQGPAIEAIVAFRWSLRP